MRRGGADGIYRGRGDRYRTGPLHPSRTGPPRRPTRPRGWRSDSATRSPPRPTPRRRSPSRPGRSLHSRSGDRHCAGVLDEASDRAVRRDGLLEGLRPQAGIQPRLRDRYGWEHHVWGHHLHPGGGDGCSTRAEPHAGVAPSGGDRCGTAVEHPPGTDERPRPTRPARWRPRCGYVRRHDGQWRLRKWNTEGPTEKWKVSGPVQPCERKDS